MNIVVMLLQIISLAKVNENNLLNEIFNNLRRHKNEKKEAIKGYTEWFLINKLSSNTKLPKL